DGPALDLAGRTDLGLFAATIARLDLLVTNDTGASHLAAAAGTPSVILFGPSRPERWAPLDRERHRPVDALALAPPATGPALALQRLPVGPVLAACAGMLSRAEILRPARESGRRAGECVSAGALSPSSRPPAGADHPAPSESVDFRLSPPRTRCGD
ncbi:MAG: hypothetical protein M3Q65_23435, partial [Chloroflexota bacterium]|nr:hypothetical protein [Chloroflexota bacterium]